MKKSLILVILGILNMFFAIHVNAQASEKYIEVKVTSTAATVNVGQKVFLTAETLKHGSVFTDYWVVAEQNGTYLKSDTESYVSTATFTADKPGIYKIEYNIIMYAGKSDKFFKGTASYTIEVKGEAEIIGAEMGDVQSEKVFRPDGKFVGYSAMGNVYIVRSDNTRELYSTMFFFFEPFETSKSIEVTIEDVGKVYKYNVPVII